MGRSSRCDAAASLKHVAARSSPSLTNWRALLLVAAGVLGLAVLLRSQQLFAVSFWFDEASAWRISQFPRAEMWNAIARDAHPPLFYLLQALWQSLFGTSIAAARSLSLLTGLATVFAAAALAICIVHSRQSAQRPLADPVSFVLLTALLFTLHPLQIAFSQVARPYQFGECWLLLAALCLLRALNEPARVSYWGGFVLSSLLLTYTHYYGLLSVTALLLFATGEVFLGPRPAADSRRRRRQISGVLISAGLLQFAWWPWLSTFQSQLGRAQTQLWMPPLQLERWLQIVGHALSGVPQQSLGMDLTLVIVGGMVCVALLFQNREGRLLAWMSGFPIVAATTLSVFTRNILEPRYLIFAQGAWLVGVALVISTLPRRSWRGSLAAIAILGSVMACREYARERDWHASHSGLSHTVDYLLLVRQADQPVLVSSPFVFASLSPQVRDHSGVFTISRNDPDTDCLAGPALLAEDSLSVEKFLDSRPPILWTVDAENLWGRSYSIPVPDDYAPAGQVRFAESFGLPMQVIVRKYRLLKTDENANANAG